jgi:hypothetical protein
MPHDPAPNGASPRPTLATATTPRRRRRQLPPGMVRAIQAARWCSVSLRVWRSWDSSGVCPAPAMRRPGCVLWSVRILRRWRDWNCPERRTFEAMLSAQPDGQQHARQHAGRLPR